MKKEIILIHPGRAATRWDMVSAWHGSQSEGEVNPSKVAGGWEGMLPLGLGDRRVCCHQGVGGKVRIEGR